jgi:peroxiredoxin (alkyl hydroperoxide reductase subunit C)
MVKDPLQLPDDLPIPHDDGAADHLTGMALPAVALPATNGTSVRLDQLEGRTGRLRVPAHGPPRRARTRGRPGVGLDPRCTRVHPAGVLVPDDHGRFAAANVRVLGLSTRTRPTS